MSKTKPSLLEELKVERTPSGRVPYLIQTMKQMGEQERKELIEALQDVTITSASISRALKRRGHNISSGSIAQYRRGEIVHEFA
jgi:hypothetical protein